MVNKSKEKDINNDKEVESNEPLKVCGIVMPIAAMDGYAESHWKDIKSILETAISEAGFEARMVNEADDIGVIHKRIVQNLYNNQIIVCDISGRNPNVMFELGLRLAFDKPTIIIKDEITPYSFDTASIEHLTYPKDLRYHKIEVFKEDLKDRIKKTYEAYEKDPDSYSTFLKNYGDFKAPIINEQTVPLDQYMLDEIKGLRSVVNQLSRNLNKNNERSLSGRQSNLSFESDHTLTLVNETTKHIDDLYMEVSNLLDSPKVIVIKASNTSLQIVGHSVDAPFTFFAKHVKDKVLELGYKVSNIEGSLYLITE